MLSDAKYAELFPSTSYGASSTSPSFGEYAQAWLNGREIVKGTRDNYLSTLNLHWMQPLARVPVENITPMVLRRIIGEIAWKNTSIKRTAITALVTVLNSAVRDGLLERNPAKAIELPKRQKKIADPFTLDEAESIISWLYTTGNANRRIYAAYFEFAFYTGMRSGEIAALRWDEVDMASRTAHVCRIVVDGEIKERTKTRRARVVMLNTRAIHALQVARDVAETRLTSRKRIHKSSPYVFPPAMKEIFINRPGVPGKQFSNALEALGIRRRPQYNCRHTYATMCLMAGMNPAFIASQLGHSIQMLLSTYAKWIHSTADWGELGKLENQLIGTKLVRSDVQPGCEPRNTGLVEIGSA